MRKGFLAGWRAGGCNTGFWRCVEELETVQQLLASLVDPPPKVVPLIRTDAVQAAQDRIDKAVAAVETAKRGRGAAKAIVDVLHAVQREVDKLEEYGATLETAVARSREEVRERRVGTSPGQKQKTARTRQ